MNYKRIEESFKILIVVLLILFILKTLSGGVSYSKNPSTPEKPQDEIKSLNNLRNKELYPGISGDLNLFKCKGKDDLTCGVSLYNGNVNPSLRRYSIINLETDKVIVDSVPQYFIDEHIAESISIVAEDYDDYNDLKEHENAEDMKYLAISTSDEENFNGYMYLFNEFKNMDSYIPTLPGVFVPHHTRIDGTDTATSIGDCIEAGKDTYDVVGITHDYDGRKCFGFKDLNDRAIPKLKMIGDENQQACTNGKNIGGSATNLCSV